MASENYGYMAPIKAALDSSLAFLAKSFSRFSRVRFNAVAPGLLKTSASAGIPGYVDAYLYAEQVTLRKQAVQTEEAAHVAAFLLSPRSSGINAQRIVVDAGMSINYFDRDIVRRAMRPSRAGFDRRTCHATAMPTECRGFAAGSSCSRGAAIALLCGRARLRCQSTASISALMPEPMPSRATRSLGLQMALLRCPGPSSSAGPPSRCCPASRTWQSRSPDRAQRLEHQLAMRGADLVAERLVESSRDQPASSRKAANVAAPAAMPSSHQPFGIGLHQRLHAAGHGFVAPAVAQIVAGGIGPASGGQQAVARAARARDRPAARRRCPSRS